METGLTKQRIIAELSKSPHGKLSEYVQVTREAAQKEPEFLAHLIAWDRIKGQVRDAKVALPVISLTVPMHEELEANSWAAIELLNPREFLRAYEFALEIRLPGKMRAFKRLVESYLRRIESDRRDLDRAIVQHRRVLKRLYALTHTKPSPEMDAQVLKGEAKEGSMSWVVNQLKTMSPTEAAGEIITRRIPFLVARAALGKKFLEPDCLLALIKGMSPNELVTNAKNLEKWGMKANPALRGAFQEAMERAQKSTKNVLKSGLAAEVIQDEGLKNQMRDLQKRQLKNLSVEGDWAVLADKSGSMSQAIELAKNVAAVLAQVAGGKVYLIFFDTSPQFIDVTGLALDEIKLKTRFITAAGGTSIGCGLNTLLEKKIEVDGIAIVSDGGENNAPLFPRVLVNYNARFEKNVPVYLYQTRGDKPHLIKSMQSTQLEMQVFDLTAGNPDYYSISSLVQTMRTNRYSLVDEIMDTRLLTPKFLRKEVTAVA